MVDSAGEQGFRKRAQNQDPVCTGQRKRRAAIRGKSFGYHFRRPTIRLASGWCEKSRGSRRTASRYFSGCPAGDRVPVAESVHHHIARKNSLKFFGGLFSGRARKELVEQQARQPSRVVTDLVMLV